MQGVFLCETRKKLFSWADLYIAALKKIAQKYNLELYGYTDDHKVAFRIQGGNAQNQANVLKQLNKCLREILEWLTMYRLKTELILYGTKQQLAKVKIPSINVVVVEVKCVNHVRDLWVLMENTLKF